MSWPRFLGPVPTLKDINLLSWLLFISIAAGVFVTHRSEEQVRLTDFAQVYSVGRILNEYPSRELYNYPLQQKLFSQIHTLTKTQGFYGPSPYPPFVAILFRPFARMPYVWAYLLWICITIVLYVAGIAIITRRFFPEDPLRRLLILCLALAFNPFLMGTVVNGQLACIGFFAVALALREDDQGRPVSSGLALSICAYKPTLLILIVPMLFLTKRVKTLVALGIGALALILFATAFEGLEVWSGYLQMLLSFGGIHSALRLPVYIHLRAFTTLLSPRDSWVVLAAVWGLAGGALVWLVRVWASSVGRGKTVSALVWATTITWTLLLNIYVPVYDAILLIISVVASARALKNVAGPFFSVLCVIIFLSVWVNVEIAERTGVQVLTILLAAFGTLQLYACKREIEMSAQSRPLSTSNEQPERAGLGSAGPVPAVSS
jgi:hypothetical protein